MNLDSRKGSTESWVYRSVGSFCGDLTIAVRVSEYQYGYVLEVETATSGFAHGRLCRSAFIACCVIAGVWLITGPVFHWSDT